MLTASSLLAAISLATIVGAAPAPPVSDDSFNNTLGERDTPASTCYTISTITQLVGDGDPHIDVWAQQVSDDLKCDQTSGCSEAYSTSTTIGYSIEGGAGLSDIPFLDDITADISFGFSLEESYSVSTQETCPGGSAYSSVCVWNYAAFSAVTVQTKTHNSCGNDELSDPFIMHIPMQGANFYYCVENTCRTNGQGYWTYNVGVDSVNSALNGNH